MFLRFIKFFDAPTDSGVKGGGGGATLEDSQLGKEDIIEFLGADEEPEVIPLDEGKKKETPVEEGEEPEELPEGEDGEETDELKEIENEIEGPSDEQLELVTPVRRREILAKYPQIFKDFPYLEKAYYREQKYTELLPTLDDAKVAVEKSNTLDKFEQDLIGGNTETILKTMKETNPRSFYKIVDNYMNVLGRVDEKAQQHVIGNIMKHTIMSMVHEARNSKNEALQSAAHILNQYVFGNSEFVPPKNLVNDNEEKDARGEELRTREQEFQRQQFTSARDNLNTRVNNAIVSTIDAHIDPRQSMTDYIRKNAVREANENLERLISGDSRFKVIMDKLWESAFKDRFSQNSIDRIKSAYLSKAKTLLPSVIKQARINALKGTGRRVVEDRNSEVEQPSNKRGPIAPGKPRPINSGKITKASDIPKGMRTLDFLNSD